MLKCQVTAQTGRSLDTGHAVWHAVSDLPATWTFALATALVCCLDAIIGNTFRNQLAHVVCEHKYRLGKYNVQHQDQREAYRRG